MIIKDHVLSDSGSSSLKTGMYDIVLILIGSWQCVVNI